mgnify:CR=1 FL=1
MIETTVSRRRRVRLTASLFCLAACAPVEAAPDRAVRLGSLQWASESNGADVPWAEAPTDAVLGLSSSELRRAVVPGTALFLGAMAIDAALRAPASPEVRVVRLRLPSPRR